MAVQRSDETNAMQSAKQLFVNHCVLDFCCGPARTATYVKPLKQLQLVTDKVFCCIFFDVDHRVLLSAVAQGSSCPFIASRPTELMPLLCTQHTTLGTA